MHLLVQETDTLCDSKPAVLKPSTPIYLVLVRSSLRATPPRCGGKTILRTCTYFALNFAQSFGHSLKRKSAHTCIIWRRCSAYFVLR